MESHKKLKFDLDNSQIEYLEYIKFLTTNSLELKKIEEEMNIIESLLKKI